MEEKLKTLYMESCKKWRSWLRENYLSEKGVWLVYYKKHTGKPSISYSDAVEEAICFGWIDGKIKKIDGDRYMQRYTPRTLKSIWSEVNVERAERMIKQRRMTKWGFRVFKDGTKNIERVPSSKNFSVPPCLKAALSNNKKAWNNFQGFSPSAKLAYVYWVNTAKTEETRQKRIKITIGQLTKNRKFGETAPRRI